MDLVKKLIKASMYINDHEFPFTDLKPHNIYVTKDGMVKITDFEYKTTFDCLKYFKNRYGSVYFVSENSSSDKIPQNVIYREYF